MADYRSWALLKTVKSRYLHVSLLSKRLLKLVGIESNHCIGTSQMRNTPTNRMEEGFRNSNLKSWT